MGRVNLEKEGCTLVDAKLFIDAMRQIAAVGLMCPEPYERHGLMEISRRQQTLSLVATDCIWGACIVLPCATQKDAKACFSLDRSLVAGAWRNMKISGESIKINVCDVDEQGGHAVIAGEQNIGEVTRMDPTNWSDAWTREGFDKESRSDVLVAQTDEFMDALAFTLKFAMKDDQRPLLKKIHLRRWENGTWRAESTDGHRAAMCEVKGSMVCDVLLHQKATRALLAMYPLMDKESILLAIFNQEVDFHQSGSFYARSFLKDGKGMVIVVARDPQHTLNQGRTDFPPLAQVTPKEDNCWVFPFIPSELEQAAREIWAMRDKKEARKRQIELPNGDEAIFKQDNGAVLVEHQRTGIHRKVSSISTWLGKEERKPLRVGFNPRYLMESAKAMVRSKSAMIYLDPSGDNPVVFTDIKGGKILVMPIRG